MAKQKIEMKKLKGNFSKKEQIVMKYVIAKLKLKGVSYHAKERMQERNIHLPLSYFIEEMTYENMLEVSVDVNGRRGILFRSKKLIKGNQNLAFFVGEAHNVATCWTNHKDFHHHNKQLKYYDNNIDASELFKGWV